MRARAFSLSVWVRGDGVALSNGWLVAGGTTTRTCGRQQQRDSRVGPWQLLSVTHTLLWHPQVLGEGVSVRGLEVGDANMVRVCVLNARESLKTPRHAEENLGGCLPNYLPTYRPTYLRVLAPVSS